MKRKVDISELYDLLIQRAECYVLCFDMVHMTQINAISQQAGDRAILECLKRLDDATGENMLLFRIGGDEFALVTDLTDPESVRALAMQILARNDEPLIWEGRPIKLALRAGATRIRGGNLRYPALFSRLHETIASSRQAGELVFCDD